MMKHFEIVGSDGVRLHGVQAGATGPVLILLHGFPEFWQAWHRQLDEFSRDHRVVALDLRGYNLSDKPRLTTSYGPAKLVDDLRCVIRQVSPNSPVCVVGHDWGGLIAWESPELLQQMIIINAPHPVLFYRELTRNPSQTFASSYAGFFQLPGISEWVLRAFDFAALRRMVFGLSARPDAFSDQMKEAYRAAWSQPGAISAGLKYYRNCRTWRNAVKEPTSWRIRVPTLVLWGEKDPALRPGNLDGLDELVSPLTVKRHPAATHWIVHEEPEWVNAAIRTFRRRGE
jgi:pimeloyl-ACP methyl ester carboxylesterase